MVRFIGIEIEGFPQIPHVSFSCIPLWKKSNLVFIKPINRASVQKFCTIGSVQFIPCPHLAIVVCVPGCALAVSALLNLGLHLQPAFGVCVVAVHGSARAA